MAFLGPNFFTEQPEEFDIFDEDYYKLPFCDEDMKDLKGLSTQGILWGEKDLESELTHDIQYHHGLASPGSPSSMTSGSSVSPQQADNAHLLLKERPDTPLQAVKFEDFSNDYGLEDLGLGDYPAFVEQPSYGEDEDMNEIDIDGDSMMAARSIDMKNNIKMEDSIESFFTTGSERTVDCSLAAVGRPPSVDSNQVITISKGEDGIATIRPNLGSEKEDSSSFSFSKDQRIATSLPTPASQFTSKPSQVYICDQATILKSNPLKIVNPGSHPTSKPLLEDITEASEVSTPIAHKIKVAPQAKITTNTFTHKTQIQIPTSTLQTILKNGRLVTRLQQQGGKIHIKTESCEDSGQFVKICQPQVELPPTPPSSSSSDAEGSSSPRSGSSSASNSPSARHTHIRVQPSSTRLAAQLLSSSQRFTQTHGPLLLTEEEKRTLVAEGYSIPSKLPLSKSEEKSLKKVRRKIKNKLSAQESRRKKKEYVETLEKRMDDFNKENLDLKRKVDSLENSNRSLLSQLRSLQTLVAGKIPKPSRTVTTQTSSCLMMLVLCFAVFLGGWYPRLSPYGTSSSLTSLSDNGADEFLNNGPSRVLFSYKEDDSCHGNKHCHKYGEEWSDPGPNEDARDMEVTTEGGSDTYDEPAGGGFTMNDTGDEGSKIIANTMEPRSAADVIASRKVVIKNSRMKVVVDVESPHDVTKKIAASAQLITE